MKKYSLMLVLISGFALAKPGDLYLANIKSIEPGKPVAGKISVTVNFTHRCYEEVLNTFTASARPISLSNPHVGVGVVLQQRDSDCDPTKEFESKSEFKVSNIVGLYTFLPVLQSKPNSDE